MKTFFPTVVLAILTSGALAADQAGLNDIKPGMPVSDASKILSGFGISDVGQLYDMDIKEGYAIKNFPIDDSVVLEVSYAKKNGNITNLCLITSPAYRPIKGLEVFIPLMPISAPVLSLRLAFTVRRDCSGVMLRRARRMTFHCIARPGTGS